MILNFHMKGTITMYIVDFRVKNCMSKLDSWVTTSLTQAHVYDTCYEKHSETSYIVRMLNWYTYETPSIAVITLKVYFGLRGGMFDFHVHVNRGVDLQNSICEGIISGTLSE